MGASTYSVAILMICTALLTRAQQWPNYAQTQYQTYNPLGYYQPQPTFSNLNTYQYTTQSPYFGNANQMRIWPYVMGQYDYGNTNTYSYYNPTANTYNPYLYNGLAKK